MTDRKFSRVVVGIKQLHSDLPLPTYMTPGAAGCDVVAAENVTIQPGGRCLVKTGIILEVPEGHECQIRPRSGLALTHGVTVLNAPGTIDSDYRGELGVLLHNTSDKPFEVLRGSRIAQLVFARVSRATFRFVDQVKQTDRSAGGWGSTGVG